MPAYQVYFDAVISFSGSQLVIAEDEAAAKAAFLAAPVVSSEDLTPITGDHITE